ncbi:hypothetical protein NIES2104_30090 [Leptolyngbya sp. NIES-2104]|nr:hypothetical protein NIES2104_30090 [Leptolyngbya sp. NIES-2104]
MPYQSPYFLLKSQMYSIGGHGKDGARALESREFLGILKPVRSLDFK